MQLQVEHPRYLLDEHTVHSHSDCNESSARLASILFCIHYH